MLVSFVVVSFELPADVLATFDEVVVAPNYPGGRAEALRCMVHAEIRNRLEIAVLGKKCKKVGPHSLKEFADAVVKAIDELSTLVPEGSQVEAAKVRLAVRGVVLELLTGEA